MAVDTAATDTFAVVISTPGRSPRRFALWYGGASPTMRSSGSAAGSSGRGFAAIRSMGCGVRSCAAARGRTAPNDDDGGGGLITTEVVAEGAAGPTEEKNLGLLTDELQKKNPPAEPPPSVGIGRIGPCAPTSAAAGIQASCGAGIVTAKVAAIDATADAEGRDVGGSIRQGGRIGVDVAAQSRSRGKTVTRPRGRRRRSNPRRAVRRRRRALRRRRRLRPGLAGNIGGVDPDRGSCVGVRS